MARLALEILQKRYDPSRYNAYFFYASDGENAAEDRDGARAALGELAGLVNYAGYVETGSVGTFRPRETQLAEVFGELKSARRPGRRQPPRRAGGRVARDPGILQSRSP